MAERRSSQREMSFRASYYLPFQDEKIVKQAVSTIHGELATIRHKEGEVIFPYPLSYSEREAVRRHKSNIGSRIGVIYDIRLDQGMGTVFEIKKKR